MSKGARIKFQGAFRYVTLLLALFALSACGGSGGGNDGPVTDTTPPDTTISSSPDSLTNMVDAEFVFTATETGSSFECSLDGGVYVGCTSPQAYIGLSEDTHTFSVRATDSAGNTDATPATYNWQIDSTVVDTTPPDTTVDNGPANPTNNTDAGFTFTATESGSTFECSLDGGTFTACSSPQAYNGLSVGTHIFRVRATDAANNTDATPVVYNWQIDGIVVDTTPPDTTLGSGPTSPTNVTTASLAFSATEAGSTFECSLDGSGWSACTSPRVYSGISGGNHTFRVRATDAAGNADASPATHNWQVDLTPPDTIVGSGPRNPANAVTANFTFASTETGSTFECALDSGSWSLCTSPKSYSGLGEGSHVFSVRATDAVSNTDASPANFDWQIDLTPPDTTLNSGPDNLTNATSADFVFTATETGSTFECALDSGTYAACTSPKSYAGLTEGNHEFRVRAIDMAGNTDDTPAGPHAWVVDITPPETSINNAPTSPIASADASFSIASDEMDSTFQCALDGGSYTDCSDPVSYSGLSEGSHSFSVRAIDAASNTDATPASHDWVIDITPPVVTAPTDITVIAADASGSPVTDSDIQTFLGGATAMDNNDGDVTDDITPNPLPPTVFPIGITTVTFTVTDAAGNTGSATADVEVIDVDNIPPDTSSVIINSNAEYAVVIDEFSVRLSAADNIGVTTYLVTEHNATDSLNIVPPYLDPKISDSRWVPVTETANLNTTIQFPLIQTYSLSDTVELCVWFMDEQGNISDRVCDSILFGNDWENGWGNWSANNGVWGVGTPTAGPANCFSSAKCAGTGLDGNYPVNTDSRLTSATMILPTVVGAEEIHLRFQNWFSYAGGDGGQVQVQMWDEITATWGNWQDEGTVVVNTSAWSIKDVDLTAYDGAKVRIAFFHAADPYSGQSSGWYIDDVQIVTSTPVFSGDFEAGWSGWGTDRGVWQIGTPTVGPANCFSGTECAGTELDANYPVNTDSRLTSATMTLPTAVGAEEIHLRFQNWFSYAGGDGGQVQVQMWDEVTATWGSWQDEGIVMVNTSGWSIKDVDLTAYAGEKVRIAFFHAADPYSGQSSGWYIDDVQIVTSTPVFSGDFEAGWSGWGTDRGVWQIGTPTVGPANCFSGTECAGTELDGNYPVNTDSRLTSATMTLPTAVGAEEIHLRFQNWFSYAGGDGGQVQVQMWDEVTATWGSWQDEGTVVVNTSGWSIKDVDLTAYAGEKVRIAFFHAADPYSGQSNGWYIDDVSITKF